MKKKKEEEKKDILAQSNEIEKSETMAAAEAAIADMAAMADMEETEEETDESNDSYESDTPEQSEDTGKSEQSEGTVDKREEAVEAYAGQNVLDAETVAEVKRLLEIIQSDMEGETLSTDTLDALYHAADYKSATSRARSEGQTEGRKEGRKEGHKAGKEEGLKEGKEAGLKEGEIKGRNARIDELRAREYSSDGLPHPGSSAAVNHRPRIASIFDLAREA